MMRPDEDLPETIDLMDEFWRFLEQTRTSCLDDRIQIFKNRIIQPNISYYSPLFGINEDGLGHYITETQTKINLLRSEQYRVLDQFHEILKTFRAKFPEFQTDFVMYSLPSLNLFKGMAVPSQGQIMLLLGIDALSQLTASHFKGYLTHELFHMYHFQRSPAVRDATESALRTMKMPAFWGLLWTEGIACSAVRMIFPDIPEEEVLDWAPLVEETKSRLPDLAREARRILTSDSPQDISGFFYFPRDDGSHIPTGCGYYIGMLVAGALAQKSAVDQLICLEDDDLICEIDSVLLELQR